MKCEKPDDVICLDWWPEIPEDLDTWGGDRCDVCPYFRPDLINCEHCDEGVQNE